MDEPIPLKVRNFDGNYYECGLGFNIATGKWLIFVKDFSGRYGVASKNIRVVACGIVTAVAVARGAIGSLFRLVLS